MGVAVTAMVGGSGGLATVVKFDPWSPSGESGDKAPLRQDLQSLLYPISVTRIFESSRQQIYAHNKSKYLVTFGPTLKCNTL